jgi:Fic family protein
MKPPYKITGKILDLYGNITESLGICKSLLLFKPEAKLRKQNRIKTIHSSLSIEGNTLGVEDITTLLNNVRIIGPGKDIIEVQNAIRAYDQLNKFKPYSINDFLKVHGVLMNGLIENPGHFRNSRVGILKGKQLTHLAPDHNSVHGLMKNLFKYIKTDNDPEIIKSCVFHYEAEFIHPFEDGNGRIGRYWQTRILMNVNPIFEYVPVEQLIKNIQKEYYKVLALSDRSGASTAFIEFMLEMINISLRNTIEESKSINIDFNKRIEYTLSVLTGWFDRKAYMKVNKGISTATASRDLKQLLEQGVLISSGAGRMTRYKRRNS